MPYVVISRYTRTDITTKWHNEIVHDEKIWNDYTDMMLSTFHGRKTRTITQTDPNTLEVEFVWENQAAYEEFKARSETIAQQQMIENYNNSVGITAAPKEEFEI